MHRSSTAFRSQSSTWTALQPWYWRPLSNPMTRLSRSTATRKQSYSKQGSQGSAQTTRAECPLGLIVS